MTKYHLSNNINEVGRCVTYKKKRLIVKVTRFLKYFGIMPKTETTKKPQYVSKEEEQALRIWSRLVHSKSSELLYNPATSECFVEWKNGDNYVFLFLESRNLRIVNTVVGYDIPLSQSAEAWCSTIFSNEVNHRRIAFKHRAIQKATHTLDALEIRIHEAES